MKNKILIAIIFVFIYSSVFPQAKMVNEGANIIITSGGFLVISENGDYRNKSINGNNGEIELNGVFKTGGDITDNCTGGNIFVNVNTGGEVIFTKNGTQKISSNSNFINFENLTIQSNSTAEIEAGNAVTVTGDLIVDGNLYLKSPLNNGATASLLTKSNVTVTGAIKIERYISSNMWHYFASPIDVQSKNIFSNPGYIYYWDDSADEWWDENNFKDNSGNIITLNTGWKNMVSTNFDPGKGYLCYETSVNKMKTFSGTINTGDVNFTLQYYNKASGAFHTSDFDGWNLIGNPYTSAIDWDDASINTTHIDDALYFYDDNGSGDYNNYKYYIPGRSAEFGYDAVSVNGGSRYIPAMQSFFIKASDVSSNNQIFTIPEAARVHNLSDFYKSGDENELNLKPNVMVKLSVQMNDNKDEAIIRFIPGATKEYDRNLDAFKRYSTCSKVPQIFFCTPQRKFLAVSTFPEISDQLCVPVGFKPGGSGKCTFKWNCMNIEDDVEIFLIDKKIGKRINLNEQEYSFEINGEATNDRFYLFFKKKGVFMDDKPEQDTNETTDISNIVYNDISINLLQNNLVVDAINSDFVSIEIYDSIGKKILSNQYYSELIEIPLQLAKGLYIVKVKTNNNIKIKKIFVD